MLNFHLFQEFVVRKNEGSLLGSWLHSVYILSRVECKLIVETKSIYLSFMLQNDIIGCAQQVEMLVNQLTARMEQLQQTVQSKTAVPTAQVYVCSVFVYNHSISINLLVMEPHETGVIK